MALFTKLTGEKDKYRNESPSVNILLASMILVLLVEHKAIWKLNSGLFCIEHCRPDGNNRMIYKTNYCKYSALKNFPLKDIF